MFEWIEQHKALVGWFAGVSVVTFVGTLIVVPLLVVRIPQDYFSGPRHQRMAWWQRHPVLRWIVTIAKNGAGAVFLIAGLAMLVLPGQGLITMVVGVLLIDFPGKYHLERWLASRRWIMRALNWMRRRGGRPPLDIPRGVAHDPKGERG